MYAYNTRLRKKAFKILLSFRKSLTKYFGFLPFKTPNFNFVFSHSTSLSSSVLRKFLE